MKAIYKYSLHLHPEERPLLLPKGAEVLDLQMQDGFPYLWAVVDPKAPDEQLRVLRMGTGQGLAEDCGRYLGTVQDGSAVWHYFAKPY